MIRTCMPSKKAKQKGNSNIEWSADDLRSLLPNDRLAQSPFFLKEAVEKAGREMNLSRVWVFGSRARGDQRPLSDYDVAFEQKKLDRSQWVKFVTHMDEFAKTLLSVDWVL